MAEYLNIYSVTDLEELISKRPPEIKLGEAIQTLQIKDGEDLTVALKKNKAKFVLLGLPEDIGVRANGGRAGTSACWKHAIRALLNTQSHSFIHPENILMLGNIDFDDLMIKAGQIHDMQALRKLVEEIDERVEPLIRSIVEADKIPIVIGGG